MNDIAMPQTPSSLALWIRAVRPFSFTASAMPVVVGAALALAGGGEIAWPLLPLVLVGAVGLQAATNLLSDVADFDRGVDRPGTHGGSGVLVEGLMTVRQVFWGGMAALTLGSLIGLALVYLCGLEVLWFGLAGVAGAFFYGSKRLGYKYLALGDAAVFILMGPLIVCGAHFVLTGRLAWLPLMVSLPVGCLVTAILHANNTRDIRDDLAARSRTLANLLGLTGAKVEYVLLVAGAYGVVVGLVVAGAVPVWCLLTALSLPLAIKNVRKIIRAQADNSASIATLDVETAQLHLTFCVLLAAGLAIGALT